MSDLSSKPADTLKEVTLESNEKPYTPLPSLQKLAGGRLGAEAVLHPETTNARPEPLHVDPTKVLTSVEVITGELHTGEGQPYILESNSFETLLNARRNVALRLIQDLDMDIQRLEAEIEQRNARRTDLSLVVARADAALGLDISRIDKRT